MALWGWLLNRAAERRIADFQIDLMSKHIEEVQNIYREMRGWRHDYHNHIQAMKAYRALGENERLDEYLAALDADLTSVDKLIRSGNIMLDAILNSKLSLASNRGISVNAKAVAPTALKVAETDLCVIIGNLLDNAIEACGRAEPDDERFIRVYIDVKRDQLYISVTNTSGGKAQKRGERFFTTKGVGHGFGLARIDRLVGKYGGYLRRAGEEGAFTTEILLPL